jgi:hypothetical protein
VDSPSQAIRNFSKASENPDPLRKCDKRLLAGVPPRGYEPGVPEVMADTWKRIEAFDPDDPDAGLPFSSRLAREQGWTHAEAARAILEYKRFLYLAVAAGHPVSPSEAVDQVWHLHLLYTRSYWKRLCGEVLGCELHHEPTQGGTEERGKFADWYERTLASYRHHFREEPPADLWPSPQQRAAMKHSARWVDPACFWIISKFPPFCSNKRFPFS